MRPAQNPPDCGVGFVASLGAAARPGVALEATLRVPASWPRARRPSPARSSASRSPPSPTYATRPPEGHPPQPWVLGPARHAARTPPGLGFPAGSPRAHSPATSRPDLTGRRGTISTEQQWQKYRPGCGDASAMATAASASPAPRAAPAAGRLLLPRRPTRPRTLTHSTHGTHVQAWGSWRDAGDAL